VSDPYAAVRKKRDHMDALALLEVNARAIGSTTFVLNPSRWGSIEEGDRGVFLSEANALLVAELLVDAMGTNAEDN
jgi:hypothetical protein